MHEHIQLISEDELCLDLINSEHFDYRGRVGSQDHLEQSEWVMAFAHHWHLPVTSPPDALALTMLRALRAVLRRLFESVAAEQSLTDAQIEELNTFVALTPLSYQVRRQDGKVRLQTMLLQTGWTAALTHIAASWVELVARTPASRLKVCANPACRWVFVDQSHNLSRRWCRQWACGNVMKVRHFRARHALSEEGPTVLEENAAADAVMY